MSRLTELREKYPDTTELDPFPFAHVGGTLRRFNYGPMGYFEPRAGYEQDRSAYSFASGSGSYWDDNVTDEDGIQREDQSVPGAEDWD